MLQYSIFLFLNSFMCWVWPNITWNKAVCNSCHSYAQWYAWYTFCKQKCQTSQNGICQEKY